jgi:hypothetical protein
MTTCGTDRLAAVQNALILRAITSSSQGLRAPSPLLVKTLQDNGLSIII